MTSHQQSGRTGAIVRMLMYAAIVLSPLILVALLRPLTDHSFIYTVGKNLALVGFTILAMQFVLSARLKWIERPFGLNVLFQFHKAMAILASLLLISHPVLLAIGGHDWSLIFGPEVMWHIWLGRIALLIVLAHVMLASFRFIIKLNYETWRFVHNLGAVLILPLGFFHSWKAGGDFQDRLDEGALGRAAVRGGRELSLASRRADNSAPAASLQSDGGSRRGRRCLDHQTRRA